MFAEAKFPGAHCRLGDDDCPALGAGWHVPHALAENSQKRDEHCPSVEHGAPFWAAPNCAAHGGGGLLPVMKSLQSHPESAWTQASTFAGVFAVAGALKDSLHAVPRRDSQVSSLP